MAVIPCALPCEKRLVVVTSDRRRRARGQQRANLLSTVEAQRGAEIGPGDVAHDSPLVVLHRGVIGDPERADHRSPIIGGKPFHAARSVREALGLLGGAPRQRPTVRGSTLDPHDDLGLQRIESDPVRGRGGLGPAPVDRQSAL